MKRKATVVRGTFIRYLISGELPHCELQSKSTALSDAGVEL